MPQYSKQQLVRLTALPDLTTNNQAEYVALVSVLVNLRTRLESSGKSPRNFNVWDGPVVGAAAVRQKRSGSGSCLLR